MSAYRTDYIIYGWKLPYDVKTPDGESIDFWDDKFLPMIEGHQGEKFAIILDDMSGEYAVFGIKVNQSDDGSGWDFVELSIEEFNNLELISKYKSIFQSEPTEPAKLFIFSNFS